MARNERINKFGEVFTPPELVFKCLDWFPCETWSDPTKTIIDPAGCGNGNFLVEVIKRKIEHGSTPLQALNTTFGIDIMQDNIDECRERLLLQAEESSKSRIDERCIRAVLHNIIRGDALDFDWDKFEQLSFNDNNEIKGELKEMQDRLEKKRQLWENINLHDEIGDKARNDFADEIKTVLSSKKYKIDAYISIYMSPRRDDGTFDLSVRKKPWLEVLEIKNDGCDIKIPNIDFKLAFEHCESVESLCNIILMKAKISLVKELDRPIADY
jgi:hypothetical protein